MYRYSFEILIFINEIISIKVNVLPSPHLQRSAIKTPCHINFARCTHFTTTFFLWTVYKQKWYKVTHRLICVQNHRDILGYLNPCAEIKHDFHSHVNQSVFKIESHHHIILFRWRFAVKNENVCQMHTRTTERHSSLLLMLSSSADVSGCSWIRAGVLKLPSYFSSRMICGTVSNIKWWQSETRAREHCNSGGKHSTPPVFYIYINYLFISCTLIFPLTKI